MDKTLIEQLAVQLGTTTEYLWSVLIAQAPISATITLLQLLVVIVCWFAAYKLHKFFVENGRYDDDDTLFLISVVVRVIVVCALTAASIMLFANIDNVINGFLHPEYWALQEVMRVVAM